MTSNQTTTAPARLYWIDEDSQGELFGGEFDGDCYGNRRTDEGDREMAEQAFLVELLNQCADETQRDAVKAGRFFWRGGAVHLTVDQLETLRGEAARAGDDLQVDLCERALAGDAQAISECAEAIGAAAAMGD